MKNRVIVNRINFTLLLALFVSASLANAGDITLNDNEILLIENTTYTNKGNITLNDNSQLIIRNSTFNFEQDYHEQYRIVLNGNSALTIESNSVLTSNHRFQVPSNGNSSVTVTNSVALNEGPGGFWDGAIFQPNDNSTFSCNNSRIDLLGDMYSYSDSTKATISVKDSRIRQFSFHFPLNSTVHLQNIKKGLIQNFQLLKSNTNLPYDLVISNTTIEGCLAAWIKDNAQVTFTNCEFTEVSPDQQSVVNLIDSKVDALGILFSNAGITATLDGLESGLKNSLSIDLSSFNSFVLNISNTYIGGWHVKICGNDMDIQIDRSNVSSLRPMCGYSLVTVTDSTIDKVLFWDYTGIIDFDNCVVGNWYDTRNYPPGVNNFLIKGTVTFIEADLICQEMGDQWFDTIVRREFPCLIQISDLNLVIVEVLDPNGNLVFSGNPDASGSILFQLTFDNFTYDKTWKLRVLKNSDVIVERDLLISSSTPMMLSSGSGGGGGGGCFIATASYGSPMEQHVKVLRDFRDLFMINNCVGKSFIDLYNTHSPPVADFISNHDTVRLMVRWILLPLVGMSWMTLNIGLIPTLTIILLMLILINTSVVVLFKKIRMLTHRT